MYTLSKLQQDLEKARENLREVEDHIQKVDGKPFTGSRFGNKSDLRNRFSDQNKELNDSSNVARKRYITLDPRKDLRENLKLGKGDLKSRPRDDLDHLDSKKARLAEDDLIFSLKRNRERRQYSEVSNYERRGDDGRPRAVFSRLSGMQDQRDLPDPDDDDDLLERKPAILSRVCPAEEPSRAEVLEAQRNLDEQSKQRNRRMFGALVGTLQQFRRDETRAKEKEAQRQRIDAKLEEEQRKEKEKIQQEKRELLVERKRREVEIKRIEWSLNRVKEFAAWESSTQNLQNFIRTEAKPHIFYLPKRHNETTNKLLEKTKEVVKEMIETRLKNLNEEIENSEKKAQRAAMGETDPLNGVDKENLDAEDDERDDEAEKKESNNDTEAVEEVQEGEWEEAEKQQVWQEDGDMNEAEEKKVDDDDDDDDYKDGEKIDDENKDGQKEEENERNEEGESNFHKHEEEEEEEEEEKEKEKEKEKSRSRRSVSSSNSSA